MELPLQLANLIVLRDLMASTHDRRPTSMLEINGVSQGHTRNIQKDHKAAIVVLHDLCSSNNKRQPTSMFER